MAKTLKVTTTDRIQTVDVDFDDFRSIQKTIGGHFETVHTQRMLDYFGKPMLLLVDEEGILKSLPSNHCGSWMYGTDKHGHIIAGDFILAEPTKYGDILPPENLNELKDKLMKDFDLREML